MIKNGLVLCYLLSFFIHKQLSACAPLAQVVLLNQSVSGNNLLLDWESNTPFTCSGYSVEVELACINSPFSGLGPFYVTQSLTKTMLVEAYPQQTISLSGLCPGQVYQFRGRESWMGAPGTWTSLFTFTVPGVFIQPVLNLSSSTNTVCQGQGAQLTASAMGCGPAVFNYTWLPSGSLSCSNCANPVASPSANTTYTCLVQGNQVSCWSTSNTLSIAVSNSTTAGVAFSNFSLCSGSSATVGLNTYAPLIEWEFSPDAGTTWNPVSSASNATSFTTVPLIDDVCYRAFVNGCGLAYTTNVTCVDVFPLPQLTITSDTSLICAGETVTLSINGSAVNYTWSTGSNNASISVTPTATTTYSVYATDGNECSNLATYAQQVSVCTGLNNLALKNDYFKIYPNPGTGNFSIVCTVETKFLITNELGQVMRSGTLDATNNYTANVLDLPPGIYFISQPEGNGCGKKIFITN